MIERKFRITSQLFPRIRKNAKQKVETDSFRFFVNRHKTAKFSVIVSGKQKLSAVARNTVRRRTYQFIREKTNLLEKNFNILCYYKEKSIIDSQKLAKEFDYLLKKIS